jgi:hypothetical protein
MYNLVGYNGKLVGLLFNFELTKKGPPFGDKKKGVKTILIRIS